MFFLQCYNLGPNSNLCPTCGKRFKLKKDLIRHLRIHTGEKPFQCSYCSYSANIKGNLTRHITKMHNLPWLMNWINFSTIFLFQYLEIGPNDCTSCGKKFKKNSDLIQHIRIHTGEKPFSCPYCHIASNHKGNLKKHILNIHDSNFQSL